jgi:hypothetical protein
VAFGDGAQTNARQGANCYASTNGTPGQHQTCFSTLNGTGTATMQLTTNGGARGSTNEFNVNNANTSYAFGLRVVCRDITTPGSDTTAVWHDLMLSVDGSAGSTTLTAAASGAGSVTTPDIALARGTAGFTWALSADVAYEGIIINATPPNSHTWDCTGTILSSAEVQ